MTAWRDRVVAEAARVAVMAARVEDAVKRDLIPRTEYGSLRDCDVLRELDPRDEQWWEFLTGYGKYSFKDGIDYAREDSRCGKNGIDEWLRDTIWPDAAPSEELVDEAVNLWYSALVSL